MLSASANVMQMILSHLYCYDNYYYSRAPSAHLASQGETVPKESL